MDFILLSPFKLGIFYDSWILFKEWRQMLLFIYLLKKGTITVLGFRTPV